MCGGQGLDEAMLRRRYPGATLRNGCRIEVESEQHTQGPSDGRAGPGDWHRAARRATGTHQGRQSHRG
jgi:hypothetical protein